LEHSRQKVQKMTAMMK